MTLNVLFDNSSAVLNSFDSKKKANLMGHEIFFSSYPYSTFNRYLSNRSRMKSHISFALNLHYLTNRFSVNLSRFRMQENFFNDYLKFTTKSPDLSSAWFASSGLINIINTQHNCIPRHYNLFTLRPGNYTSSLF